MAFHSNGQVARIALDQPTRIPTPVGVLSAELVLFYANGALQRVLPTNGKLSEFWSETEERELVPMLRIPTALGDISARFIALGFYEHGQVRSLTLWPGERLQIVTPVGRIQVRQGLSLYPDGALQSLEPARPTLVSTPLGPMHAYDPEAIGLAADANSLRFSPQGELVGLTTDRDALLVTAPDGSEQQLEPTATNTDACTSGGALRLGFVGNSVTVAGGSAQAEYPLSAVKLRPSGDVRRHLPCLG